MRKKNQSMPLHSHGSAEQGLLKRAMHFGHQKSNVGTCNTASLPADPFDSFSFFSYIARPNDDLWFCTGGKFWQAWSKTSNQCLLYNYGTLPLTYSIVFPYGTRLV